VSAFASITWKVEQLLKERCTGKVFTLQIGNFVSRDNPFRLIGVEIFFLFKKETEYLT